MFQYYILNSFTDSKVFETLENLEDLNSVSKILSFKNIYNELTKVQRIQNTSLLINLMAYIFNLLASQSYGCSKSTQKIESSKYFLITVNNNR